MLAIIQTPKLWQVNYQPNCQLFVYTSVNPATSPTISAIQTKTREKSAHGPNHSKESQYFVYVMRHFFRSAIFNDFNDWERIVIMPGLQVAVLCLGDVLGVCAAAASSSCCLLALRCRFIIILCYIMVTQTQSFVESNRYLLTIVAIIVVRLMLLSALTPSHLCSLQLHSSASTPIMFVADNAWPLTRRRLTQIQLWSVVFQALPFL